MLYIGMRANRSVILHRFNGHSFSLSGYIDHIDIGNGASATNSPLGYMRYIFTQTYLVPALIHIDLLFKVPNHKQ